jgi:hypothetical protein
LRGLIRQLRVRLRAWLLKEEIAAIGCLLVQSALVVGTGENLVRQNGLVLQELEAVRVLIGGIVIEEICRRDEQGAEWHKARQAENEGAIAKLQENVDRLVELITPKAERLQGRRPVGGWDEVLNRNLDQFQEAER